MQHFPRQCKISGEPNNIMIFPKTTWLQNSGVPDSAIEIKGTLGPPVSFLVATGATYCGYLVATGQRAMLNVKHWPSTICINFLFVCFLSGDAVWQDWWQCLHPGLPVSLLCCAGLCSGFSQCYSTPQMRCPILSYPELYLGLKCNLLKGHSCFIWD